MKFGPLDLTIAVLCTGAVVEFVNHASLIQSWREKWQCTTDRFFSRLLLCPYCFSHWAAAGVVMILIGPHALLDATWTLPGYLAGTALAVTRAANLLNDGFRRTCRTPGHKGSYDTEGRGADATAEL